MWLECKVTQSILTVTDGTMHGDICLSEGNYRDKTLYWCHTAFDLLHAHVCRTFSNPPFHLIFLSYKAVEADGKILPLWRGKDRSQNVGSTCLYCLAQWCKSAPGQELQPRHHLGFVRKWSFSGPVPDFRNQNFWAWRCRNLCVQALQVTQGYAHVWEPPGLVWPPRISLESTTLNFCCSCTEDCTVVFKGLTDKITSFPTCAGRAGPGARRPGF